MSAPEEVFKKVRNCLVEALGVDEEEVTLDSSITADLGGESIDFLDIVFRLEKTFGIKIPPGTPTPIQGARILKPPWTWTEMELPMPSPVVLPPLFGTGTRDLAKPLRPAKTWA